MNNQEYHKYRVVGSQYLGHEKFTRANEIVVAHTPEEANDIAFREFVIPSKIKDLGTIAKEAMKL